MPTGFRLKLSTLGLAIPSQPQKSMLQPKISFCSTFLSWQRPCVRLLGIPHQCRRSLPSPDRSPQHLSKLCTCTASPCNSSSPVKPLALSRIFPRRLSSIPILLELTLECPVLHTTWGGKPTE